MPTPSTNKGDRAERELVAWLVQNGYPLAHRSRAGWSVDIGVVLGIHDLTFEVKSAKTLRLGPWLDELDAERANAGTPRGVLVVEAPAWEERRLSAPKANCSVWLPPIEIERVLPESSTV